MPSRQDIYRADLIGVCFKAALDALEPGLRLSVVFRHMAAARAGPAGVVRRYSNDKSAVPSRFVLQLSPEFAPALIVNSAVQARLLFHPLAVLFAIALGRLGHIPNLQIFDGDHGVVLADLARSLVQKVFPGIGDAGMNALDAGVCLLPVVAEFDLATHAALIPGKALLGLLEAVERIDVAAVTQGGETGDPHVDADRFTIRNRLFNFALRLDRYEPFTA